MRRAASVQGTVTAVLGAAVLSVALPSDAGAQRDPRIQQMPPPPQQQQRGFFRIPLLDRIFGVPSRTWGEPPPQRMDQMQRQPAGAAPQQRRPVENRPPPRPKVEPKHFVGIIGDGMAEALASGLEDALYDRPEIALVRKTDPQRGLLDEEPETWAATVRAFVASAKVDVVVVSLGNLDQHPMPEGDAAHAFRSARWNQLYAARADEVLIALAERRLPIVWLGLPPVENEKEMAGNAHINEILRQRVIGLGGVFLDVWEGFVDDDGNYAAVGHALDGREVRLRLSDGIGFTEAGARKYAHYAETEIRRLFPPEGQGGDDKLVLGADASVHVLTSPPRTPGATLLSAELPGIPRAVSASRPVPAGRADDFRWPAGE